MNYYILPLAFFLLSSFFVKAQDRIITAGSANSEIVCELGLCDKIIATDRTSLYPSKLTSLPSIGYRSSISAEGIISQKPDLVIFEKDYVKDELITQIKSTGIKTLVLEREGNFESTKNRIRAIATALDKEKEGEALITKIETELDIVKQKVNASQARPTILCVYARGMGTMQVAGAIDTDFEILEIAGAKNALPEVSGYKPLNAEALIQTNPDYILFFESGLASVGGIDKVLEVTGVAQTTAGKKRQIIAIDGIKLTNWGPRIAEAAQELFQLTHPTEE
ncbi:heme/hemin ABC transporter substrate-binding protein [Chondrinema litorale]|uniref:heme/hemin ABC transporter substrate-binding protein n=1 Tax=Chondrinema litorale TaxID=2994555 RepID=UPI0025439F64|nr:ABC transporter substrate-binding protein [Chondrinema litorale]UZR99464.1 ABC transporter substrate-binding protein [Chondrinema litorale]